MHDPVQYTFLIWNVFLSVVGVTITLGREVGPDAPSQGGSPPKVVVTLQETNYRYAPADVNSAGLSSITNGLVFLPAEYNAVIFNTYSYNSLGNASPPLPATRISILQLKSTSFPNPK